MKILVFSDSHGCCENMLCAIEYEIPDYIIHLGDHASDVEKIREKYPMLPILQVRGNCDYYDVTTQDSAVAVYDTVRVWAVHGHKYGVKNSLLRFYMAARENAAHVALFGHTHCAYCEEKDGIWLLNPGTCGNCGRVTYGFVSIDHGTVQCEVKNLPERNE